MSNFTLASPEFKDQEPLQLAHEFDGYNGAGQNRSPALQWRGAPEGTKSFALTLYDPDAPTGSGFWHWILFDIDSSFTTTGRIYPGVCAYACEFSCWRTRDCAGRGPCVTYCP